MSNKNKIISGLVCGIAAFGLVQKAGAQLVNGGFESTTAGGGQLGFNTDATGWTAAEPNYAFIFTPGSADTTGVQGQYGNVQLWGPNNGGVSVAVLPATSPDGGNYVGMDSAFQNNGPLSQTVNNLVPGQSYSLSFYWAAAQQNGFGGASFESWQVTLGSQTQTTPTVNIPSTGFSGWLPQTMTFTPNAATETLNFLAVGGPDGIPPFVLLDGVSLTVPDSSSTVGLFGVATVALLGFGARSFRRRQNAA